jgi:hypothetical protein
MIVSGGGEHLIAAAKHELPHYLCRHVRVARLGEIAVGSAANKATFALWIKPSSGLAVWNYGSDWGARCLLCACSPAAAAASSAWSVLLPLSAASALIAAASSVMTVVALAGMALLLIAITLLTAFALLTDVALLLAACTLGIVGCLLL